MDGRFCFRLLACCRFRRESHGFHVLHGNDHDKDTTPTGIVGHAHRPPVQGYKIAYQAKTYAASR